MNHPFFRNISSFITFVSLWVFLMLAHSLLFVIFFDLPPLIGITDSAIFNALFMILSVAIWYTITGLSGKRSVFNQIINQLTAATAIILIWYFLGTAILRGIYSENSFYLTFLSGSLPWRIVSGLFLYLILLLVCYLILYYDRIQERIKTEGQMREMLRTAELDMLKSQINPHFLFNSLNSISSLTITDPPSAQKMVVLLSDFLRYSVSGQKGQMSTLGKEIENIERYLEIEKVRFGSKLTYTWDICDNCDHHQIPAMILQPLYENAVKHGVYESTEQIVIQTKAEYQGDLLILTIGNNFDPEAHPRKGNGIGLKNTRDRLQLIYANETLLKTTKKADHFSVKLTIPKKPYYT